MPHGSTQKAWRDCAYTMHWALWNYFADQTLSSQILLSAIPLSPQHCPSWGMTLPPWTKVKRLPSSPRSFLERNGYWSKHDTTKSQNNGTKRSKLIVHYLISSLTVLIMGWRWLRHK